MRKFLLILFLLTTSIIFSQSDALAKNYFEQGEFEKALNVYEKLTLSSPYRMDYFLGVVQSHQQLENFSDASRLIKQKLASARNYPQLFVELGYNYSLQNQPVQAEESYQNAIQTIDENPSFAYNIGQSFQKYSLLKEAVAAYEKAMELNEKLDFNMQLAQIYGEQGMLDKMFEKYLNIIEKNQSFKNND